MVATVPPQARAVALSYIYIEYLQIARVLKTVSANRKAPEK